MALVSIANYEAGSSVRTKLNALFESHSARVFVTSQSAAVDDADLSLGSSDKGTDSQAALQAILDEAASGPIFIIWDGHYGISTLLTIRPNTHIWCMPGCGVILQDSLTNGFVFKNYNFVASSSSGGYGSNIVDENITIENMIINGNGENVPQNAMISMSGVRNLNFINCRLYQAAVFMTRFENIQYFVMRDCIINQGTSRTKSNLDGLHIYGYADNIYVDNLMTIGCNDDSISLMTSEDGVGDMGPISNVTIRNWYISSEYFGLRLSVGNTGFDIKNFVLDGYRGVCSRTYAATLAQWPSGSSGGLIENATFRNIDIDISTASGASTFFSLNAAIKNVTFENIYRNSFNANVPFFLMSSGSITNFTLNGYRAETSSTTHSSAIFRATSGTIQEVNITNVHNYFTAASAINSAVIEIAGATVPRIRLSNVHNIKSTRLVYITSGTVSAVVATNITCQQATAAFYTDITVARLVLGNWDGPSDLVGTLLGGSGSFTLKTGEALKNLGSLTYANLPTASVWPGAQVYVSDEADGPTMAFSNGTNWIDFRDGAAVTGP